MVGANRSAIRSAFDPGKLPQKRVNTPEELDSLTRNDEEYELESWLVEMEHL